MNIIIIGLGSVARNIVDILKLETNYNILGFVGTDDENKIYSEKKVYKNYPFLGTKDIFNDIKKIDVNGYVVAIGDRNTRENIFNEAKNLGITPINAISKNAIVEGNISLGQGVIIGSGSIIQNGSKILNNTHIGSGVIVDIDCDISSNCNIRSGSFIGRRSVLKKNCDIGYRSSISPGIKIGKNQLVDNYKIIDKDLPDLIRK